MSVPSSEKKQLTSEESEKFTNMSWNLIDKYFKDNPNNLVAHHLESYNNFFTHEIHNIFKENNPIRFIERENKEATKETREQRNQCLLYLGGKDGSKIYFGKPIIYDDNHYTHYMYPNDARLRNMTYGITIHYDVDIEFKYFNNGELVEETTTLEKLYLGRFPIMLQSKLCILNTLSTEARFNLGECRNDYGGYFIIDGKEKLIVSQEKFADNMLYIKKNKKDNVYSYSAEIRSVSEDTSKPIRTTSVKMVAGPANIDRNTYSMEQLVVNIPNVFTPIPLFIVFRALGITSDKNIIEYCLLDLEKYESYVDLFIPSIHDASKIFNQETAIRYIATHTKRGTITSVLDILMNYFLPHIGENNFLDKAYFLGYMVKRLLRVHVGEEKPTDRDNFRFKRVELPGNLIYNLFREYFLIQKKQIALKIDMERYYHPDQYTDDRFTDLINLNYVDFFKERIVESGFRKAFKGNWGAEEHTKRIGVVQDLNRLSWNSFISQLRKFNLPLDASAKVVGPRLLHASQWGFIDPVDTPDGGNIGLHKHMAISTLVTSGSSAIPLIKWLRSNIPLKLLQECTTAFLGVTTKLIINGSWIGVVTNPLGTIRRLKLYRRNGLIPTFTSISFNYDQNEIYIYTDAGRLTRPIFYLNSGENNASIDDVDEFFEDNDEEGGASSDNASKKNKESQQKRERTEEGERGVKSKVTHSHHETITDKINSHTYSWENVISGFMDKKDPQFHTKNNKIYEVSELYDNITKITDNKLIVNKAIVDYIDTAEEEGALIATTNEDLHKSKYFTHMEINPSFILGVLGNLIIYPENNPLPRNAFSCGQSKQAVSLYHSNYQMRIDKMGVVLNYGQIPLVKSRYLEYINKEQMPYGVNTIVAIMSHTGYNVEDAILINEGSVKRGLFRTTYYSMYEAREESPQVSGSSTMMYFDNIMGKNVSGIKPGYDYSHLDKWGIIKENTALDDKMVLIGKITSDSSAAISVNNAVDSSVFPKKGQLGFVDKAFITEGEEGFRLAKIRVREERLPAIGDKMASRAGQKGTIGLIIPEQDMPFTADGVRPDLIINPHALPSRMTIGHLIESLLGKACVTYGGFGDCTAFANKGMHTEVYDSIMVNAGYHSSGNQVMYNGLTGEQLSSDIYIGPTYYMRLKHMVKDKINYRARGPNTMLTRQSVQGRANDGGLRIGEMERDGILAHGCAKFLNESYMVRGDEYYMAVCNKSGGIAIYNESLNLFYSPFADGPTKFKYTDNKVESIQNVSRFGRSFSIVRIPYSLKLLIQELQVMNVQMRIITENNIDQLMSMSYSNNINNALSSSGMTMEGDNSEIVARRYVRDMSAKLTRDNAVKDPFQTHIARPSNKRSVNDTPSSDNSVKYEPTIGNTYNLPIDDSSPVYVAENSPVMADDSPAYDPNTSVSSRYEANTPDFSPPSSTPTSFNPDVKEQFDALSDRDKEVVSLMVEKKKDQLVNESTDSKDSNNNNAISPQLNIQSTPLLKAKEAMEQEQTSSILNVDEEPKSEDVKDSDTKSDNDTSSSNSSDTKKIITL
jgi:DNA-directed RNA polymerase II subunit RPB2